MGDQQAGVSRMPIGPDDAARRARLTVPAGSGVVMVYISQGLSVMRSQCAADAVCGVLPDFGHPNPDDRCGILLRVVTSAEPLVWVDWRRWHVGLATTWGGTLVDVLVVSPTHWRSVLTPAGQGTSEPRRA